MTSQITTSQAPAAAAQRCDQIARTGEIEHDEFFDAPADLPEDRQFLTTRLLGRDVAAAKKIAARRLPNVAPTVRVELLARSLGYQTAAAFQAGFKAIPAAPEVVATPLVARDATGPAFALLGGLCEADQRKAAGLGAEVIAKLLQDRFRVSMSAQNKVRQISTAKLFDLGPLAAGALAARRIIAEALLLELTTAPLVIQDEDIREAWLATGATAAPPAAEGVAAALLLALDLGLDAQAIADLDAHHLRDGKVSLGSRIVADAGGNARDALEAWIGPFGREGAALTPSLLYGATKPATKPATAPSIIATAAPPTAPQPSSDATSHTSNNSAIAPGARCDADALDALVFAATGSKKVGLGALTLRDAAVASRLILCVVFGKSVEGAARRLGVPARTMRTAVAALGGKRENRERDQTIATHLGVSLRSAARQADAIGAIKEEAESAIDIFVAVIDRLRAEAKKSQSKKSAPPAIRTAPVVFAIEKASAALALIEIMKPDNKASAAHVEAYFQRRGWDFDFRPSILSRPRNPVNGLARELIDIAWNEGDVSDDDAAIAVDWLDTYPTTGRRDLVLDGPSRLDVCGDGSACVLVEALAGRNIRDLLKEGGGGAALDQGRRDAWVSGLKTELAVQCLPFAVSVRGMVQTANGVRIAMGSKELVFALLAGAGGADADRAFDPDSADLLNTREGCAALRRQLEREIEALHDYAKGRSLGVQPATRMTALRDLRLRDLRLRDLGKNDLTQDDLVQDDLAQDDLNCAEPDWNVDALPWTEPYHLNQLMTVTGHELRLRWRLGDAPTHAHLSRDPYSREERRWAQEALDLACGATMAQTGMEMAYIEAALTAPNLATGAPAGVIFLGNPMGLAFAQLQDAAAPVRIASARTALLERLAAVVDRFIKPGFVFRFGREILPLKLAHTSSKTISGDPKVLDRRLKAHLARYPGTTGKPGVE